MKQKWRNTKQKKKLIILLLIEDAVSANGGGGSGNVVGSGASSGGGVEGRLQENAVTMNKMTDLRAQMEKLNMARRGQHKVHKWWKILLN